MHLRILPWAKGCIGGQGEKLMRSHDGTTQKTLKDIGINHNQSSRWQQLAPIPLDNFELIYAIKNGSRSPRECF